MDALGRVSHFSLPRFSIVILNYNNADLTFDCLESVAKSDYDLSRVEIIVVDNNSVKQEKDKLLDYKCKGKVYFKLILNDNNLLYTGGNNQGIMYSKGEYIIILNNDTIVDSQWLEEIDRIVKTDLSIGIAQSKILINGTNKLDTSIPKFGWFGRGHCLGLGEEDNGQYDNEPIDYACGACMVLSRNMLSEVGLFDARFGMHCEDLDLSLRAKRKGYKVVLIPKAKVWHIRQATMKKVPKWIINWYILKNRILLMLKYGLKIS